MNQPKKPSVTLKLAGEKDQMMSLSEAIGKATAFHDQNVGSSARFQLVDGEVLDLTEAKILAGKQ